MHLQGSPCSLVRVGRGACVSSREIITVNYPLGSARFQSEAGKELSTINFQLLFASLVDEFVAYILLAGKDEDVVANTAAAEL